MNEEQKKQVSEWYAAGQSLDEIQKRIRDEFSIRMSYFDLRMLVAEFPPPIEQKAETEENVVTEDTLDDASEPPADLADAEMAANTPPTGENATQDEMKVTGSVSVTIEPVAIPGTIANGSVTFTDGVTAKWYLDQMGRMGLSGTPEGYRPTPSDAALFQRELVSQLQRKGLM